MIKTILVPATGSDTDEAVFTSALAVARAFDGRMAQFDRGRVKTHYPGENKQPYYTWDRVAEVFVLPQPAE